MPDILDIRICAQFLHFFTLQYFFHNNLTFKLIALNYTLSDDDRPIRLQGTLGALMDGIGGKMSVTELTAALSEGGAEAVCELSEGAGTAYYVGDRYADIQFDSDWDGEYDSRLLISIENAEDEDVDSESTAWFEILPVP